MGDVERGGEGRGGGGGGGARHEKKNAVSKLKQVLQ